MTTDQPGQELVHAPSSSVPVVLLASSTPVQVPVKQRRLSASAMARLLKKVPPETRRAYEREWNKFLAWCQETGEDPIPCDTDVLTNWTAERCDAGHSVSIIRQGISAVVFMHEMAFGEDADETPGTKESWKILGGYRKDLLDSGWRPDRAATVTPEEFRAMVATLPGDIPAGVRDRAILGVTLGAFFRRSNTHRLDIEDATEVVRDMADDLLHEDPESTVELFVSRSKTDQAAVGKTVILVPGEYELSDPVGLLLAWICELRACGITSGPLWRPFSNGGRILDRRLNADHIRLLVRDTAKAAKITNPWGRTYKAHSLRASGVTIARRAGKPWSLIEDQGGWAPGSVAAKVYDRPEEEGHALRGVGL